MNHAQIRTQTCGLDHMSMKLSRAWSIQQIVLQRVSISLSFWLSFSFTTISSCLLVACHLIDHLFYLGYPGLCNLRGRPLSPYQSLWMLNWWWCKGELSLLWHLRSEIRQAPIMRCFCCPPQMYLFIGVPGYYCLTTVINIWLLI